MADITARTLLSTPTVTVTDMACQGTCRHKADEECATIPHLAFAYRGVFVRHLGRDDAVADANQVLLFNPGEGYRVSHPLPGGDRSLDLVIEDSVLREILGNASRGEQDRRFPQQRRRIDARTQALVALLRHRLHSDSFAPLEAESMALTLAQRALGPGTSHTIRATAGQQRLVHRVKMLLVSDLARRWTLAEIAHAAGGSPVYLTQVFRRVEGIPLYRYHVRLRLARALDLIDRSDDLAALGEDLGFSSHSHFSAAFRQAYGRSPTDFRLSAPNS